MPALQEDYSQVKKYQEQAAAKNYEAAGMAATATTLPDEIMKAVREGRQSRGVSKLATDVGNTMGYLTSDPMAIRQQQMQGLMDPYSVNALTSNARVENQRMLGVEATQLSQNQGTLDQVIQAGANQLKARAQTLLAQAEQATAAANTLQQEWERGYKEQQLALDQYKATHPGGGGSTLDDILKTAAALKGLGGVSAGEEDESRKAQTVLNTIDMVKSASTEDLKKAAQMASTIGLTGAAGLINTYAKWTSTPAQQELAGALANARNVLRLDFTGAAFSQTERPEYAFLTGDWVAATKDPERVKTAMKALQPYFSSVAKAGVNPYRIYKFPIASRRYRYKSI